MPFTRDDHVFAHIIFPGHQGTYRHLTARVAPLLAESGLTARYNLLSPLYATDETDIFAFARQHNVGVLIKQVLGQGLLLDRHQPDTLPTFSTSDHRSRDPRFTAESLRLLHDRLAPIRSRFGETPVELARVALRYALQHAPDAAVLVGFRNAAQIRANVTCLGEPLSRNDIAEIRTALHIGTNTLTTPEGHPK